MPNSQHPPHTPHTHCAKTPKRVDRRSSPGTRCEGRAWQIRPQPLSQWIVRLNRTMAICFCMAADGRAQSGKHGLSPADLNHPTHSVSLRLDRRAHSLSCLPKPVCRALSIRHTPPTPTVPRHHSGQAPDQVRGHGVGAGLCRPAFHRQFTTPPMRRSPATTKRPV